MTPTARDDKAERKRREAELRQALKREVGPLRDEVARLEAAVTKAEKDVADVTRALGIPGVFDDPERARKLTLAHGAAKDRAAELMGQWEDALMRLEEAESRVHARFAT